MLRNCKGRKAPQNLYFVQLDFVVCAYNIAPPHEKGARLYPDSFCKRPQNYHAPSRVYKAGQRPALDLARLRYFALLPFFFGRFRSRSPGNPKKKKGNAIAIGPGPKTASSFLKRLAPDRTPPDPPKRGGNQRKRNTVATSSGIEKNMYTKGEGPNVGTFPPISIIYKKAP